MKRRLTVLRAAVVFTVAFAFATSWAGCKPDDARKEPAPGPASQADAGPAPAPAPAPSDQAPPEPAKPDQPAQVPPADPGGGPEGAPDPQRKPPGLAWTKTLVQGQGIQRGPRGLGVQAKDAAGQIHQWWRLKSSYDPRHDPPGTKFATFAATDEESFTSAADHWFHTCVYAWPMGIDPPPDQVQAKEEEMWECSKKLPKGALEDVPFFTYSNQFEPHVTGPIFYYLISRNGVLPPNSLDSAADTGVWVDSECRTEPDGTKWRWVTEHYHHENAISPPPDANAIRVIRSWEPGDQNSGHAHWNTRVTGSPTGRHVISSFRGSGTLNQNFPCP